MNQRAVKPLIGPGRIGTWLLWTALVGILTGCSSALNPGQPETTTAIEPTYVDQATITETTVGTLGDGWSVGVQWVSNGRYVDAEGNEQRGRIARIGVWNDELEQSETLEVYEGLIFTVGEQRFQVIEIVPNSSLSVVPGSSNGYVAIGQLAEGPVGTQETGNMSLTLDAIERLFEDGTAHVYRQDGRETIDLYCHVVEGAWCYFVPQGKIEPYDGLYDPQIEDEARRIASDFARQITRELDVEAIAHSRNNGVKVRCARPEDARSLVACQVDRGGGWLELAVLP